MGAVMIKCEIRDRNDKMLFSAWMREVPRIGEYLWATGSAREAMSEMFGTSSLRVVEVAHWVTPDWTPDTHTGEPIHSVCVYVEGVFSEAPTD